MMTDAEIRLECLRITGSFEDAERAYRWVAGASQEAPSNASEIAEAIAADYQKGMPISEIANTHAVPIGSIYKYLAAAAVTPMRRPRINGCAA